MQRPAPSLRCWPHDTHTLGYLTAALKLHKGCKFCLSKEPQALNGAFFQKQQNMRVRGFFLSIKKKKEPTGIKSDTQPGTQSSEGQHYTCHFQVKVFFFFSCYYYLSKQDSRRIMQESLVWVTFKEADKEKMITQNNHSFVKGNDAASLHIYLPSSLPNS